MRKVASSCLPLCVSSTIALGLYVGWRNISFYSSLLGRSVWVTKAGRKAKKIEDRQLVLC